MSLVDSDGLTVIEHAMYDCRKQPEAESGEIYVWGSNTNYTLGPQQARSVPELMDIFHKENPNLEIKQVSTPIPAVLKSDIIELYKLFSFCYYDCISNALYIFCQVCLSRFHCIIVSTDGRVFSCGHGQGGRLGLSNELAVLMPKAIRFSGGAQSGPLVCTKASIAQDHSVFLTDTNHVSVKNALVPIKFSLFNRLLIF